MPGFVPSKPSDCKGKPQVGALVGVEVAEEEGVEFGVSEEEDGVEGGE